jgi:hypothetical protein
VADMFGNQLEADVVGPAQAFVQDVTAPVLVAFDLNSSVTGNGGLLRLSFSESVNASSLNVSRIIFQDAGLATVRVRVAGQGVDNYNRSFVVRWSQQDGTQVFVELSVLTMNDLKRTGLMGVSASRTFVTLEAGVVRDMIGNTGAAIGDGSGQRVSGFVADQTAPVLQSFDVNMNSGQVMLTFDEVVNRSSIVVSGVRFQDAALSANASLQLTGTGSGSPTYAGTAELAGGSGPLGYGNVITLSLTVDDLNALKAQPMCTASLTGDFANNGARDCYLRVDFGTVSDLNWNPIAAIADGSAMQTTVYTVDSTPPYLTQFSFFSSNNGTLVLFFNEVIRVATLNVTSLTLTDSFGPRQSIVPTRVTLSGGLILSQNSIKVVLQLTNDDLNRVKVARTLCVTSGSTCFVRLHGTFARDMSGNSVVSVPERSVVASDYAETYEPDTSPPILETFSLNMDTFEVRLTFDEIVQFSRLRPTSTSFALAPTLSAPSYDLLGGAVLSTVNSIIISFSMLLSDVQKIKTITGLMLSANSSFLYFNSLLIMDMQSNAIVDVPKTSALPCSVFSSDATQPMLTSFTVNMQTNTVVLNFNEPVLLFSFNPTGLAFQSSRNASSGTNYTLTSALNVTISPDLRQLTFLLAPADRRQLKLLPLVAKSPASTFLSWSSTTLTDVAGNSLKSLMNTNATLVTSYAFDGLAPSLIQMDLNMNYNETHGLLRLTFDDVVRVGRLVPTAIVLQASVGETNTELLQMLRGGVSPSVDGYVVEVILTYEDTNEIKRKSGLATRASNTYISISESVIADDRNLAVFAVNSDEAMMVTEYVGDVTRPSLVGFGVDMSAGVLALTFSETLNASTFRQAEMMLQGSSGSTRSSVVLRSSVQSTNDSRFVTLQIPNEEMNLIRRDVGLYKTPGTTYLSLSSLTVQDMRGNAVVAVNSSAAMNVGSGQYVYDTVRPRLLHFNLSMQTGLLALSFDEVVNAGTLNTTAIVVQNSAADGSGAVRLSGGLGSAENSTVVEVQLTVADLNRIKAVPLLAKAAGNTFLRVEEGMVSDMNVYDGQGQAVGPSDQRVNKVQAVGGMAVRQFVADSNVPVVWAANFSLERAYVVLLFSETVSWQSVSTSGLSVVVQGHSVRLSGGTVSGVNGTVVMVQLTVGDTDRVKNVTRPGTSAADVAVVVDAGAVRDMDGNSVQQTSIGVSWYEADTVSPVLLAFEFDMDRSSLWLTFSETVNAASVRPTSVRLSNAASLVSSSRTVILTGGLVHIVNFTVTQLEILSSDLNAVKQMDSLCISSSSCFVSELLLVDMSGNGIFAIPSTNGLAAQRLYPDTVSPTATSFELNMDARFMSISFSEPINSSTVNPATVGCRNALIPASSTYFLREGVVLSSNGMVQTIAFSFDDANQLRQVAGTFPNSSSVVCALSSSFGADMTGNRLADVSSLPCSSFTPDTNFAMLLSYTLNVDNRTMTLVFNKTVEPASTIFSKISFVTTSMMSAVTLTSGNVSSTPSTWIQLFLSKLDIDALKLRYDVAKSINSTSMVLAFGAVADTNGRPALSFAHQSPSVFLPDTVPPQLISAAVDWNQGTMTLAFNEPIDPLFAAPSSVVLKNAAQAGNLSVQLSGGNFSYSPTMLWTMTLVKSDLDQIKLLPGLCTSLQNCFVQLLSGSFKDMQVPSGNSIAPVTLQASSVTFDQTPPTVVSFSVDMTINQLFFHFDEPILASSFDCRAVTVDNDAGLSYTLSNCSTISTNGLLQIVQISASEANTIKNLGALLKSQPASFFHTQVLPINLSNSGFEVQAGDYIIARSWTFRRGSGVLMNTAAGGCCQEDLFPATLKGSAFAFLNVGGFLQQALNVSASTGSYTVDIWTTVDITNNSCHHGILVKLQCANGTVMAATNLSLPSLPTWRPLQTEMFLSQVDASCMLTLRIESTSACRSIALDAISLRRNPLTLTRDMASNRLLPIYPSQADGIAVCERLRQSGCDSIFLEYVGRANAAYFQFAHQLLQSRSRSPHAVIIFIIDIGRRQSYVKLVCILGGYWPSPHHTAGGGSS